MPLDMLHDHAARLFDEAAMAGLRITDLDGWSQTRLAESLHIRREVVNAIINRAPVAEPSLARPRMVEACRKIIAFAAVVSRKDDAVVPREVDSPERLDDDAQAYETHKLRLRRVVEGAVGGGAFIEGMYRVGELSSHAVHAPVRFRVRMIGNVVTAVQRLLDKPESRSIPADLLGRNLRRLTLAEWAARGAARSRPAQAERTKAADDLAYIRGQVGYAMAFSGLLARSPRAVVRGRRRLWHAVQKQPSPDYGHWSNLLRALNDLLANDHAPAWHWARAVVPVAEKQRHPGFAAAFTRLRDNGELATLAAFWEERALLPRVNAVLNRARRATAPQATQAGSSTRRRKRTTAAAILLLVGLLAAPTTARAGDGKELSVRNGIAMQRAGGAIAGRPCPGGTAPAAFGASGGYPARPGAVSAKRAGYSARQVTPPRSTRPAALPDAGAPASAPRVTATGPCPTPTRPRYARSYGFVRVERTVFPETQLPDATDVKEPIFEEDDDEADSTSDRKAKSARPAKPRNRMFPLIVVRDVATGSPTRTTPKVQTPKSDVKDADRKPGAKSAPVARAGGFASGAVQPQS